MERVWNEFHQQLHHFVLKRVSNSADADDVIQEVFLKIHAQRDKLADVDSLRGWVYRITRNAIVDLYRRRDPVDGLSSGRDAEPPAAPLDSEDVEQGQHELAQCLRPLMSDLAEPYRQALTLTELDGLTQRRAADEVGVSLSGMKSRVQRGRRELKARLLACCHVEHDVRGSIVDYTPKDPEDCADTCGC